METGGYEVGVKAPAAVQTRVDKSRRAEEVEERLCRGVGVHKWVGGCRLQGGRGKGVAAKGNSCSCSEKWWKK